MGDIVEECRKAAGPFTAGLPISFHGNASDLLTRAAFEIEKLRKEVRALKVVNASLVARNVLLMFLLVGAVCGAFMASFLTS